MARSAGVQAVGMSPVSSASATLCGSLGIEHRLTKPRTSRTNGMFERFNGRQAQILRTHHFNSAADL